MIVLIGSKYDISTFNVSRWLYKLESNFTCLFSEEFNSLNSLKITNQNKKIVINDLNIDNASVIWHRRGRLRHLPNDLNNRGNLTSYLKKEEDALIKSLELILNETTIYVGSYIKEVENYKIYNLIKAKECGLAVPNTLVTTSKDELSRFYYENDEKIISKDLRYPVDIISDKEHISSCGTFQVKYKDIDMLEDNFAPILVQNLIKKEFEIRVFVFLDQLYAMAIFSQNNTQTIIDFRNYDNEKPNRCVPFLLPEKIQLKILEFCSKISLNSGSVDLIYTKKGEYVFLEINPMGQFDWVSKNCNYYIDKKIANSLNSYEKNN
ncbi:hypothetical protein MK851_11775 [Tenacibaculum sp. 1B UA]|uniref:hypothetical protein n=1 Tax=Tenacibaculum sp. 1B UA TaxID=2922252 RepID=UPI002A23A09F|nr:hypothetical protein [Tenacibaculum sp. 1B UA]MDX8554299.1 hypothetical protein [Tenacibaculum sp. 1B UA]